MKVITRGNLSLITPEGKDDWISMPKTLRLPKTCADSIRAIANGFSIKIHLAAQTVLVRSATRVAQELGVVTCNAVGIREENFLSVGVSDDTRRWLENEARNTPGSNIEIEATRALAAYIRIIEEEREMVVRRERGEERA